MQTSMTGLFPCNECKPAWQGYFLVMNENHDDRGRCLSCMHANHHERGCSLVVQVYHRDRVLSLLSMQTIMKGFVHLHAFIPSCQVFSLSWMQIIMTWFVPRHECKSSGQGSFLVMNANHQDKVLSSDFFFRNTRFSLRKVWLENMETL